MGYPHPIHARETAVLTTSTAQVVVLNPTLAAIWYLCDGGRTPAQLVQEICSTLPDADQVGVAKDVRRALEDLRCWDLRE